MKVYILLINKVQIEPFYFEWDRFIPTLEKEFPDILNEMLSCNSQQQPLRSNENRINALEQTIK